MNPDGCARNRRRVLFLAALAAFAPLVPAAETAPVPAPLEMRIVGGRLEGGTRTLRFRRGERVTMRWTSDRKLALHVHGYDIELPLSPAIEATLIIEARIAGRFPVTAHFPVSGDGVAEDQPPERTLLYIEVLPE